MTQPEGMHQPRHAQQRIGAEHQRIQKIVVQAAIDHIHPPEAGGGAHIDEAPIHQQIAAFHQRRPQFLGQEDMLVEGGVI